MLRGWACKALLIVAIAICSSNSYAQSLDAVRSREETLLWQQTLAQANGQTVNFYAWAGDPNINAYLAWAKKRIFDSYGVTLNHVKISDTSEAVTLILAEAKLAEEGTNGSVDLIWLNGQNFATLQTNNLLEKSWVEQLPNAVWLNSQHQPQLNSDFGLATEGSEAPWGQANLLLFYNQRVLSEATLPHDPASLLAFSKAYPKRFTYPKPPDFLGVAFLKQLLIQLHSAHDASQSQKALTALYQPVDAANFEQLTEPLWAYLDQLHPNLYRAGRYFPINNPQLLSLFDEEQIILGITFNGASILSAIKRFDLPESTKVYAMKAGSLSNVHFLAVPKAASQKPAAKLVVDFLLSPEAQAKKQDLAIWGDKTVIDLVNFTELQDKFDQEALSAMPSIENPLAELPPSWDRALSEAWQQRYGATK